jgi:serine/threonine protein kinase
VHSACVTEGPHLGSRVAIKLIELEQFPDHNLEEIRKEIQIMRLSSHPNILSYHVCFISGTQLWMVMPLMDCGSLGNILKFMFREGFEDEVLVASILKEVLQGLCYFHEHSQIHRDVKAGNILLSSNGRIYLSDFGVASKLRAGMNAKTFTGSPCWIAPEVIESTNGRGYDYKADIWSFGITAIELVKGAPPYIEFPPMKIILLVKNSDPPQLGKDAEYENAFKEIVNLCLQKDPELRPSAEVLLKKKYFQKARGSEYICARLIQQLPPIEQMVRSMPRNCGAAFLRDRLNSETESWDFNVSSENVWDI